MARTDVEFVSRDASRLAELCHLAKPRGSRFPDTWRLAAWDAQVSHALARVPVDVLPVPTGSLLLFLVGHMFGTPVCAMLGPPAALLPAVYGGWSALSVPAMAYVVAALAVSVAALLAFRAGVVTHKALSEGAAPLSSLGVTVVALAALGRSGVTSSGSSAAVHPLAVFALYFTAWVVALVAAACLKGITLRLRPAARLLGKRVAAGDTAGVDAVLGGSRAAWWRPTVLRHVDGDNAWHSFPSFDTAGSVCWWVAAAAAGGAAAVGDGAGGWQLPPAWVTAVPVLVAHARVYFLAHTLLDVAAGAVAAAGIAGVLAADVAAGAAWGDVGSHARHLMWLVVVAVAPALYTVVPTTGPLWSVAFVGGVVAATAAGVLPPLSWPAVVVVAGGFAAFLWCLSLEAWRYKAWATRHMAEAFTVMDDPKDLPPEVAQALADKRASFLAAAGDGGSYFPGECYHAKCVLGGQPTFVLTWAECAARLDARLQQLRDVCGVDVGQVDVVLGIYSAGAFLAPLLARRLACDTAYIRVSRYGASLSVPAVLYSKALLAVGLERLVYNVSRRPDPAQLAGKHVLMVDDTSVFGGTFRVAARYCMDAGAKSVRGVALAGRPVWDPTAARLPADESLSAFTPWGTW